MHFCRKSECYATKRIQKGMRSSRCGCAIVFLVLSRNSSVLTPSTSNTFVWNVLAFFSGSRVPAGSIDPFIGVFPCFCIQKHVDNWKETVNKSSTLLLSHLLPSVNFVQDINAIHDTMIKYTAFHHVLFLLWKSHCHHFRFARPAPWINTSAIAWISIACSVHTFFVIFEHYV